VQRVDLGSALALRLLAHLSSQRQDASEHHLLEPAIPLDLASDVADDTAEIGSERLQGPVGALELLGVGIALVLDQRELANPCIGLAQLDAMPLRQPHQDLAGAVEEPRIG